jgi:CheY-like chemotaxis protein
MARILIVEDDAASMDLALRIVRIARHEPITTMDGETAFAVAQATRPELILLDLHIPRLDGYAFARGASSPSPPPPRRPIANALWRRGAMGSSRSPTTPSSCARSSINICRRTQSARIKTAKQQSLIFVLACARNR